MLIHKDDTKGQFKIHSNSAQSTDLSHPLFRFNLAEKIKTLRFANDPKLLVFCLFAKSTGPHRFGNEKNIFS